MYHSTIVVFLKPRQTLFSLRKSMVESTAQLGSRMVQAQISRFLASWCHSWRPIHKDIVCSNVIRINVSDLIHTCITQYVVVSGLMGGKLNCFVFVCECIERCFWVDVGHHQDSSIKSWFYIDRLLSDPCTEKIQKL